MVIRIIKTKAQHKGALEEIARLARLDPAPESSDGLRLELLAKLVEDYEAARLVFAKPDPVDAILFRMEERGLRQKESPACSGKEPRVGGACTQAAIDADNDSSSAREAGIPSALLIREPAGVYRVRRAVKRPVRGEKRVAR